MKNIRGLTLLELIVVIAIIGLLASILIPQFLGFQQKAQAAQSMVDARQVATAADGFIIEFDIPSGDLLDKDEVADMAGVDVANIISDIENENGTATFTYQIIKGDKTHTATRDQTGFFKTQTTDNRVGGEIK